MYGCAGQIGIACLTYVAQLACAYDQPDFEGPPSHSSATLVSETAGLSPGTTATLAFVFEIDEGWHTYADSANDTGSPLLVFWSLPDGVEAGDPIWPASHRYVQAGGLLDHVYEDKLVLTLPVSIDANVQLSSGAVISASLEWLVCDDSICVPQFAEVSVSLPFVRSAADGVNASVISESRNNAGKLLTGARDDRVLVDWQDDTLVCTNLLGYGMSFIPGPGCIEPVELLARGHSDSGKLELKFDFDEDPRGTVEGWVRLHKIEGKNALPIEDKLYLVRLKRGEKPTLIMGETR